MTGHPVDAAPCPLCGASVPADRRCASCGLAPGFGPGRRDPLRGTPLRVLVATVLAVYVATLGIVALIR